MTNTQVTATIEEIILRHLSDRTTESKPYWLLEQEADIPESDLRLAMENLIIAGVVERRHQPSTGRLYFRRVPVLIDASALTESEIDNIVLDQLQADGRGQAWYIADQAHLDRIVTWKSIVRLMRSGAIKRYEESYSGDVFYHLP